MKTSKDNIKDMPTAQIEDEIKALESQNVSTWAYPATAASERVAALRNELFRRDAIHLGIERRSIKTHAVPRKPKIENKPSKIDKEAILHDIIAILTLIVLALGVLVILSR